MSTAIKVENLSKIYRLGEIGTGTISRDLERWVKMKVMGKEDPFLKIGESNDRSKKGASDIVYSLKDINFEIQQGDAVGIIGRNGAGKSTLLKILSRVTTPTTGKINIKGRVASLLEVGTGFHPELTGRENIYLNGAILGMRKKEIDRKLEEIIDFSGVERYIDTPVKRYSSGMYVRLAFAVAAHLESEILIVDEVLAVGDAEFQKKCLGKIGEVSKGEGRTVLFVSHNLESVIRLCPYSMMLESGKVETIGTTKNIIEFYQKKQVKNYDNVQNNFVDKLNVEVNSSGLVIEFRFSQQNNGLPFLGVQISDFSQNVIFGFNPRSHGELNLNQDKLSIRLCVSHPILAPGRYYLSYQLAKKTGGTYEDYYKSNCEFSFEVLELYGQIQNNSMYLEGHGVCIPKLEIL